MTDEMIILCDDCMEYVNIYTDTKKKISHFAYKHRYCKELRVETIISTLDMEDNGYGDYAFVSEEGRKELG